MKGTLVNTLTVIIGSLIGLGLCTLLIGFKMALKAEQILLVIGSLVVGGIIGEILDIEAWLEQLGEKIKKKIKSDSGNFVVGFVTASLVFCVGPMTVVGSIEDGIRGDPSILYAKSVLDGFASIAFASGLGIGVLFSAVTVLVYQGLLTLLGQKLSFLLNQHVLNELTATGGLMIVGIGLLLLDIKRIRVGNFLPALVIVVALALIF